MTFDLKKELYEVVKNIKWNFKGILDTEERLHAIPKNLNFQALFERLVIEKLRESFTKKFGIKVIDPDSIRAYPDIILEEWESSEREILLQFIDKTEILENVWNFVSVGFNLGFEHNFLRSRCKINNLPIVDILNNPFLDLKTPGVLMNRGQFKGTKLSTLTGKDGDGIQIPIFYSNKEYDKIIRYVQIEATEFIKFNTWLYKKMPTILSDFRKENPK
ncbi:hypothetical protein HYT24_02730 [Candidatus Pacearchaeota archaeon]|nr:hypothetical protein [Candidatus Pacearchaeota archaeon]